MSNCLVCHDPLRGLVSRYHALCYWQQYSQEQALLERRMYVREQTPTLRSLNASDDDFMIEWYERAAATHKKLTERSQ